MGMSRRGRGRAWLTDGTNVGLTEKKELSVGRKEKEKKRWSVGGEIRGGREEGCCQTESNRRGGAGCALTFFDHWCQRVATEHTLCVCVKFVN